MTRTTTSGRARRTFLAALLAVGTIGVADASATTIRGLGVPHGWRASARTLAEGLDVFTYVRPRAQAVRISRVMAGGLFDVRPSLAHERVGGAWPRTERTSAMCARARCRTAVNGDFFAEGAPVGGLVVGGEPIRSPRSTRPHALFDVEDRLRIAPLAMGLRVTATYNTDGSVELPEGAQTRETVVDGLNIARAHDRLVLYSSRFGPRTGTDGGVELVLQPDEPLAMGRGVGVVAAELFRSGDTTIPDGGLVLSASGEREAELVALWEDIAAGVLRRELVLSVDGDATIVDAMGGSPAVLAGGEDVTGNGAGAPKGRHPRTLLATMPNGDVLFVAVDGRARNYAGGMTLAEAASFLRALGAQDALNLDGGGSTTFVVDGRLANKPSDRLVRRDGVTRVVRYTKAGDRIIRPAERPVASALLVVPR